MPIAALDKIEAMIAGVTRDEIQALSPNRRQRLTQALRYLADLADPSKPADPRSGPLARLRDGERAENCE
jgi:hypothetical protein